MNFSSTLYNLDSANFVLCEQFPDVSLHRRLGVKAIICRFSVAQTQFAASCLRQTYQICHISVQRIRMFLGCRGPLVLLG